MPTYPSQDPRSVTTQPFAGYIDPRQFAYYNEPMDPYAAAIADIERPPLPPQSLADPNAAALQQATKAAMRRETLTNLGISGGLGALQFAAQAVPTAYDVYNRERLAEVQRSLGDLPEPVEEEFKLAGVGLRRASKARQDVAEAQQAGMQNVSVAAMQAPARAAAQQNIDAAIQLGAARAREKASNLESQLQEIEERQAYKGQRQAQLLGAGVQAIQGIAAPLAQARAGRLSPQLDLSSLVNLPPEQRAQILQAAMQARTPAEQQALVTYLSSGKA